MTKEEIYAWLDRPADQSREERLVNLVVSLYAELDDFNDQLFADSNMPTSADSTSKSKVA